MPAHDAKIQCESGSEQNHSVNSSMDSDTTGETCRCEALEDGSLAGGKEVAF
jgi:hypothetical protein